MRHFEIAEGEQRLDRDRRLTGAERDLDRGAAGFARGRQLVALMVEYSEATQTDRLSSPCAAPRGFGDCCHAAVHRLADATRALMLPRFLQQLSGTQDPIHVLCAHLGDSLCDGCHGTIEFPPANLMANAVPVCGAGHRAMWGGVTRPETRRARDWQSLARRAKRGVAHRALPLCLALRIEASGKAFSRSVMTPPRRLVCPVL